MKRLITTFALVIGLGSASGCFLFHDDYPDESCESDLECFRSMGEVCNTDTRTCEVPGTGAPAPERYTDEVFESYGDDLELEAEVTDVE